MRQKTELRLTKYNPVHTCLEGGKRKKEKAIKDCFGITDADRIRGELQGPDEHNFFKGLAGILSGKRKSSYVAPGTNQSM